MMRCIPTTLIVSCLNSGYSVTKLQVNLATSKQKNKMAPIPSKISVLSNQELASMLREYGVVIGPIVASTRSVYERKLVKLQTGVTVTTPTKYTPVDDDDESEEEEIETVHTRQTQNPIRPTRPTYSETRRRFDEVKPTPLRIPRREGAGDPVSTPLRPSPRRTQQTATSVQKKGIPFWVKLSIFVAVIVFAFIVVKNMESNAQNSIPQEIEAEV